MDEIIVDNKTYSPYFMLDCMENDSDAFVTKSFRKLAKRWHPDKNRDPSQSAYYEHMFKAIKESYEYIILKKKKYNVKKKEAIVINKNQSISTKQFDNSEELNTFNKEFEKVRYDNPNDFGYTTERMKDIKEYDNLDFKPLQLFNSKKFNSSDFNKTFEFNQTNVQNKNDNVGLYYKTTDGFNAYNSGDVGGASVSSYNGTMIVGDTFGQNGMGYYDTNYSDYQQTFSTAKNPNKQLEIPNDFIAKSNEQINTLSIEQSNKQMELQRKQRDLQLNVNNEPFSKQNFKLQESLLLQKQHDQMQDKISQDKELILQFRHLYSDQNVIEDALKNNLICNKDYISEDK
jgi:curved DNA-binding protein CbpA